MLKSVEYQLIVPCLSKLGDDGILHRSILKYERPMILIESHEGIIGGDYAGKRLTIGSVWLIVLVLALMSTGASMMIGCLVGIPWLLECFV